METNPKIPGLPWQPLTFGGVASFAHASFTRLLVVAFVIAFIVAGAVVCFFYVAWEPSLRQAIARLPDDGVIRAGHLEWNGPTPVRLADGNFLSIVVDLANSGELGHGADFQCEFGKTGFRFSSLFGYIGLPYPAAWIIALNRQELEPWWGAWHPVAAAGLAVTVLTGLFLGWGVLGAFYALPAQLIAFYADRHVSAFGAWRLAVASMLPGALLLSTAIIAYGFQQLNLIQLLSAALAQFAMAWVYVLIGPLWLPREQTLAGAEAGPKRQNPFR